MSTVKKINYIIISFIVCTVMFATAVFFIFGKQTRAANADSTRVAALSPVTTDNDEIVYKWFDAPNSVFADGAGIVVSGDGSVEYISGEKEITGGRNFGADKAYRHLAHGEHGEYLLTLRDGGITLYGEQDGAPLSYGGVAVTGIIDFAVDGDMLYALASDALYSVALGENSFVGEAEMTALHSSRHNSVTAHAVTAVDGAIYVAIDSAFGARHDICTVGISGALTVALMQTDPVMTLTSVPNTVYALTRGEITEYGIAANGGLIKRNSALGAAFTDIYAYGGGVYALDSLNALHKLSGDLSVDAVLFAASSDAEGYFNTPSGIAVKNSVMYVADTLNDRIAVYGNTIEYIEREFINPVSVACDSAGTVYVAYEYDKIGIFRDGNFSSANERFVLENGFGSVIQIAVNADKTLYILTDNGLWTLCDGDTRPEKISDVCYDAVTLGVGRDKLYALHDGIVYEIGDEPIVKCTAGSDVISFAVDLDGSVFMLTQNCVRTYRVINGSPVVQDYALALDGEKYSLGGKLGRIVPSTISNNYVGHGDVIIADGDKHRIFKTDGAALGVRLIDKNYEKPEIADNNIPEFYGDGLIRTTVRDAHVFELPMEGEHIFTIERGRNVIVPAYSLDDAQEYSLVLIDDVATGKLIQGYVYKDSLSDPLPYAQPPAEVCSVFNGATPIYKFPSRHSKALYGYAAVDSGAKFAMLDFVSEYRDDYGYLWYRVSLGQDAEGYIIAINVSTSNTEPVMLRPAYNADILSYKGSAYAPCYTRGYDGEYTKIAELATGTRIEVVGAFDSSEKYTEIKYFDPQNGTITCFVETVYVKYNGVNIVLLVAILVIIITVTLAAIIAAHVLHNKKKHLEGDDDKDDASPAPRDTK